jgi:hypothetical protein
MGFYYLKGFKYYTQAWAWEARPGPKISGLGRIFRPDGRAWAAKSWPDC